MQAIQSVGYLPIWGSGKSWGGDVDGSGNDITIDQEDGATYGPVWGNNNIVDVTQKGDHDTFLDVHVYDGTTTEVWQQDSGSKYARIYIITELLILQQT